MTDANQYLLVKNGLVNLKA